jgi:large subunit ribosomal protein L5
MLKKEFVKNAVMSYKEETSSKEKVIFQMKEKFAYKSAMAVPRLQKIVLNSGIGPWLEKGAEVKERILKDLTVISGQKPVFTLSRKAISSFKIRERQEVGIVVTLRGRRMYDFLERLIVEALPRVKDFRGIPEKSFGKEGNISIGLKEHTVFAEIDNERTDHVFGLEITVVNTAKNKEEGIALMRFMGFPVEREAASSERKK